MKTVHLYCRHCRKGLSEKAHIFDVKNETEKVVCPNCGYELNFFDAKRDYDSLISHYLKLANNNLNYRFQFLSAYQTYAHILDIEPDNIDAIVGRMIALLYLSTVRKAYFKDVGELFIRESTHLCGDCNEYEQLLYFIKRVNAICRDYSKTIKRRLTATAKLYYDNYCVALYILRHIEIDNFINILLDKISAIKGEYVDSRLTILIDKLKEQLTKNAFVYKTVYVTVRRGQYAFKNIDKNNVVTLTEVKKPSLVWNDKIEQKSLLDNPNNAVARIKDDIFMSANNNTIMLRVWRSLLVLSIVLLIVFVCLYLLIDQEMLSWLFLILSGASVVGVITSSIGIIVCYKQISSKNSI